MKEDTDHALVFKEPDSTLQVKRETALAVPKTNLEQALIKKLSADNEFNVSTLEREDEYFLHTYEYENLLERAEQGTI